MPKKKTIERGKPNLTYSSRVGMIFGGGLGGKIFGGGGGGGRLSKSNSCSEALDCTGTGLIKDETGCVMEFELGGESKLPLPGLPEFEPTTRLVKD